MEKIHKETKVKQFKMNTFLSEVNDSTRTSRDERTYFYTEKMAAAYNFCI